MRRFLRRLLIAAGVLLGLVMLGTCVTPQGRAAVRTALFIPQVLPGIPIKPQEWVTPDPVWREITYPKADGLGTADLYLPGGSGEHSAVLFFLGVVAEPPRQDQRVVALAEGLARAGMVVMLPWLETQEQQRLSIDDIDHLVHAFQYLRGLDRVDPERVGMGGICTGASMATVAAQNDRIRDHVKFVNFFAGYYDMFDYVKAMGSRSRFGDDYVAPWETDDLPLRVLRYHLIDGVSDPEDRALLTNIFYDKKDSQDDLTALQTSEAVAAYRLLKGAPHAEVDGLVDALAPKTKDLMRRISPSTNIDKLKARVLIMHDRADKLVPSEESGRFARALGVGNTYYTEFSFFQKQIQVHVDEDGGVGPLDYTREAWKLFLHMYNIMRDIS